MAKALRLVETQSNILIPNITGLLLLGREETIQQYLPTHEVHFQILDIREDVKVNDVFHGPLMRVLEEIESRFSARNEEKEIMAGLFRIPIPDYSPIGFREAVNNAFLHRDYSQLESIYIQWRHDSIFIANPGGFLEGITLNNLLIHEPKPRNPRLAETFRRIGLVEQTGRGIDKIFMGQLRYGRPAPDYSRSDAHGVRVILRGGCQSLEFSAFVDDQEKNNKNLSLDELMILNALNYERSITTENAGRLIQKGTSEARSVLEYLVEKGFIERRGIKKGREYYLSASLYRRFNKEKEYLRAKGFEPLQHEQMILDYIKQKKKITRSEAAQLCQLNGSQASRLLRKMIDKHIEIKLIGSKRGAYYLWQEPHNQNK